MGGQVVQPGSCPGEAWFAPLLFEAVVAGPEVVAGGTLMPAEGGAADERMLDAVASSRSASAGLCRVDESKMLLSRGPVLPLVLFSPSPGTPSMPLLDPLRRGSPSSPSSSSR